MKKTWWKESVIYQIYPRSFNDSNGDGIGDLRGIINKLDYLKRLGVDILWLSPIFKSPNDDNGYDISDYQDIMDEFGTMADFDELLNAVHEKGMKLLMDLVVNHSSDEHYWFTESKKSKDNPYRDYYIWKKPVDGGPPNNWQSFFSGSAWELDEITGEYYLHLFTKKQPDLNWENPKLRAEIYQMMHFWLKKGVDGFRMDVIPLISKDQDYPDGDLSDFNKLIEERYSNGPRVHEFIQEMYQEVLQYYDVMTVGEGPGITKEIANLYVGEDRKELNMIFHFGHMFIDHGKGGRYDPIDWKFSHFKKVFRDWDQVITDGGWINIFLDNHDFPRMLSRFANDKEHRVAAAKLLATLILTMRGTPCIYQGSEIGMTNVAFDQLEDYRDVEMVNAWKVLAEQAADKTQFLKIVQKQGRDNVRTPIQWDDSPNGGFSTGTPWIKSNPNYDQINVATALADQNSIWYYYQKLLQFRKDNLTLVYGDLKIEDIDNEELFCYQRISEDDTFIVLLNFSDKLQEIDVQALFACVLSDFECVICNLNKVQEQRNLIHLQAWEARVYKRIKNE